MTKATTEMQIELQIEMAPPPTGSDQRGEEFRLGAPAAPQNQNARTEAFQGAKSCIINMPTAPTAASTRPTDDSFNSPTQREPLETARLLQRRGRRPRRRIGVAQWYDGLNDPMKACGHWGVVSFILAIVLVLLQNSRGDSGSVKVATTFVLAAMWAAIFILLCRLLAWWRSPCMEVTIPYLTYIAIGMLVLAGASFSYAIAGYHAILMLPALILFLVFVFWCAVDARRMLLPTVRPPASSPATGGGEEDGAPFCPMPPLPPHPRSDDASTSTASKAHAASESQNREASSEATRGGEGGAPVGPNPALLIIPHPPRDDASTSTARMGHAASERQNRGMEVAEDP